MIEKSAPPGRIAGASTRTRRAVLALAAACGLAAGGAALDAQVRGSYLYTLSNFGGKVPYDWAQVYVDPARTEVYVVYQNLVRIFNASGMEVFSFGDDLDVGQMLDVAVDGNGDIILLSFKDGRSRVTRCNFRGVPTGTIEISQLPEGVTFVPNRMLVGNGLLYFASLTGARVIVTDAAGVFREHIDLISDDDLDDKLKGSRPEVVGFSVDGEGSLYFTIPVLFKAFKLTADRKRLSFGRPGSAAGRFGIVAGIVVDSRGRLIVADKLRSVLMVFDKDFKFLTEFGYRSNAPGGLILPEDLAIDSRDRVYVTQGARRGVSVFALVSD
jgi:hypothetical protein